MAGRTVALARALSAALLVSSLGCQKKTSSAPPAGGGGHAINSVGGGGGAKQDASTGSPDEDAGAPAPAEDAGIPDLNVLPGECQEVTPTMLTGEDMANGGFFNAIVTPKDFAVSRVVAAWTASCDHPAIVVVMSNGNCPEGGGHELTFKFDAAAITASDPTIRLGQNPIMPNPEADGIPITYTRPADVSPNGVWGTCKDANGTLDFTTQPDVQIRTNLQARFDLELTPCGGSNTNIETVTGAFNVTLKRGLSDVCPGM